MTANPRFSIVVCTHDRLDCLKGCLTSLRALDYSADGFEILVVDNACGDGTADHVRALARDDPRVRYIFEPTIGLTHARNAGLTAARGEFVLYTDDDAEPYPDWLRGYERAFDTVSPAPAAVGGEIDPIWGAPKPDWAEGIFLHFLTAGLHWSTEPKFIEPPQWICEVNSGYRREALIANGPWPSDLGRRGNLLLSNDNTINQRIREAGGRLYFDPRIRVRHHIHADRLTQTWMMRRHFWQGVSEAIIAEHDRAAGRGSGPHPTQLDLPLSAVDWARFEREDLPVGDFKRACRQAHQAGYLLQAAGLVQGR